MLQKLFKGTRFIAAVTLIALLFATTPGPDLSSAAAPAKAKFDPAKYKIVVNEGKTFQTVNGLGVFGANKFLNHYVPNDDPKLYYNDDFLKLITRDLGESVVRISINPEFQPTPDNSSSTTVDLKKFNLGDRVAIEIEVLKAMKKAGITRFIASPWSPPAWMKDNNDTRNGGKLLPKYYKKFALYLEAFIKVMKEKAGVDLYAVSLQNEPDFVEPYDSCVYNHEELAELLKVVGETFKQHKITTKIMAPEDMLSNIENVKKYIYAMDDADSLKYLSIIAVHGYGADGMTANSPVPQLWERAYNLAQEFGKELWMTETSGYKNTWEGAMTVGKDIYAALKYGRINGWVWWNMHDDHVDLNNEEAQTYAMMINNQPLSRFYTSASFYRYIRPGAVQVETSSKDSDILVVGFRHAANKSLTLVMINRGKAVKKVNIGINGSYIPKSYQQYRTSEKEKFVKIGTASANSVTLPPDSITTLYGTY